MAKLVTATRNFIDENGKSWRIGQTRPFDDLDDYYVTLVHDGDLTVVSADSALSEAGEQFVTGITGGASEATLVAIRDSLERLITTQGLSTDNIMEVDESVSGTSYIGIAPRGSLPSDPFWGIIRYIDSGTSVSKRVALNVTWTGFTTHSYS